MLDPYQKKVLEAPYDKDLLLGGYAGTGKTVTTYELGKEYEPERVLYLPHTRRQQEEGKSHFPKWNVHDAHSFALQQIHRYSPHPPKTYPGHSQVLQGYLELESKDEYDLVIVEEAHNFTKEMGRIVNAIPAGRRVAVYDPMQRSFYYNHNLCHPSSYLRDGYETRELLWNWRSSPGVIGMVNFHCGTHLEGRGPDLSLKQIGVLGREQIDVLRMYDWLVEQGLGRITSYWNSKSLSKLVKGNRGTLIQCMTIHMAQGMGFATGFLIAKTGLFTSEKEVLYVGMTRFARDFAVLSPGVDLNIPKVLSITNRRHLVGFLEETFGSLKEEGVNE